MRFPSLPMRMKAFPSFRVQWPDAEPVYGNEGVNTSGNPFFNILTDNGIAARFLEAVVSNPEDAWAFVSKNYVGALDLDALQDVLGKTDKSRLCRPWAMASYGSDPKNCLTRSVMVVDTECNIKSLLHLHMVKEPDRFGQWKIYGVEQE